MKQIKKRPRGAFYDCDKRLRTYSAIVGPVVANMNKAPMKPAPFASCIPIAIEYMHTAAPNSATMSMFPAGSHNPHASSPMMSISSTACLPNPPSPSDIIPPRMNVKMNATVAQIPINTSMISPMIEPLRG